MPLASLTYMVAIGAFFALFAAPWLIAPSSSSRQQRWPRFIAWSPQVASAQYFGQNKVHYRTFDFKVLKTEHFDPH